MSISCTCTLSSIHSFGVNNTPHLSLHITADSSSTAGCRSAHCASCMIAANLLIHCTSQPFITTERDKWEKGQALCCLYILLQVRTAGGQKVPSLQTLQYTAGNLHPVRDAGLEKWVLTLKSAPAAEVPVFRGAFPQSYGGWYLQEISLHQCSMGHWLDLQPNTRNLGSTVYLVTSFCVTLYNSLSFSALGLLWWKMSLLWWKRCLGTQNIWMLEEKWMRPTGSVRSDNPLTRIFAYTVYCCSSSQILAAIKPFSTSKSCQHCRQRGHLAEKGAPLAWQPILHPHCSSLCTHAAAWHGLAETFLLHQLSPTHSAVFYTPGQQTVLL